MGVGNNHLTHKFSILTPSDFLLISQTKDLLQNLVCGNYFLISPVDKMGTSEELKKANSKNDSPVVPTKISSARERCYQNTS